MKENFTETPKMSRTKRLSRGQLSGSLTVGIDLGDRTSRYCILNADGDVVEARAVATTRKDLTRVFGALRRSRVALEVGTHSPWVSRHLQVLGHEASVANPRRTRLIAESGNKQDRVDAETLARLARADPKLLFPIRHRGEQAQAGLAVIRVRAALVEARTRAINTARGLTKSFGERLRKSDAQSVDERLAEDLPPAVQAVVVPLLAQARERNARIREHDETIQKIARERYPETALLTAVYGVGVLMALTFILTIDDRSRFARSRDVGAYLGMRPRRRQSSGSDPALGISKAGDRYLRKLLVQGAHVILGRHGADSDLRRFGRKLAERGGKGANKKARVAVARKLAVLLHHLWVTGEVYAPLHRTPAATVAAAA